MIENGQMKLIELSFGIKYSTILFCDVHMSDHSEMTSAIIMILLTVNLHIK